jgi:hypothetical protein
MEVADNNGQVWNIVQPGDAALTEVPQQVLS